LRESPDRPKSLKIEEQTLLSRICRKVETGERINGLAVDDNFAKSHGMSGGVVGIAINFKI
jgi:hypothetical protein